MAKKNESGYLSAKESRRISRENRKITDQFEKLHKRKNVPEEEFLTQMHDQNNSLEIENLHTYFFSDVGTVRAVDGVSFDVPIGKTVGVVGTGKIGRIFAGICKGFGMRVLAYDKFPNPESNLDYVELSELLRQADVISLHCPLTDETRHMIDADAIAQMKPGVVLVNTSRGGLVDTEALIEGLKSHKVGAACLDVYEEEGDLFYEDCSEEIVADDTLVRLISMPNVIVTSHQAFLTKEALSNIAATTVDNLLKFERGEPSPDTEVCYHCERKETCRKARDQKCF